MKNQLANVIISGHHNIVWLSIRVQAILNNFILIFVFVPKKNNLFSDNYSPLSKCSLAMLCSTGKSPADAYNQTSQTHQQPSSVRNPVKGTNPSKLKMNSMKHLLLLVFLCINGVVNATNYYFSSVSGDDSRSAAQAQNPATPWKTIAKLNASFGSIAAGDSVLFKRGEIFYGNIVIAKSGTSSNPIKFGAFGTGARPIISGFSTITAWTNLGNNMWESTSAASTLTTCNIISINGTNTAYGRMPKSGYWTAPSANATSITDATHLNVATTNWTGADVAARTCRWHLDRATVTSMSGSTINFPALDYAMVSGWGYFLQNHPSACTQQNDWCYIASSKKIRIYSTSQPTNVQIPTVNDAVNINSFDYITFDNLNFQGYNSNGISTNSRTGIKILNCDFSFIADIAVQTTGSGNLLVVSGCTFSEINSGGVHTKNSTNNLIQNNVFTNVGNIQGMGGSGDLGYTAIYSFGDNAQILYNSITRTGYVGIRFDGNATMIKGNFINYTNYIKDDGGGIYCYPNNGHSVLNHYTQRTVRDNISLNALGAVAGGEPAGVAQGYCIFNDGSSPNINYINNTTSGGRFGLFFQGGYDCLVDSNTVYAATQIGIYFTNSTSNPVTNNIIRNNISVTNVSNTGVGCGSGKYSLDVYGIPSLPASWTATNNIYANPLDQTNGWIYTPLGTGSPCKSLADWQNQTGKDAGSKGSPLIVSDVSKIRFEYNETSQPKTIALGSTYMDMRSVTYNGTITLKPYSSTVLLKTGTGNGLPTANAGPDQTVGLPIPLVTLSGSGTDADGSIASYSWSKISGPSLGSLTSLTTALTTVISIIQGVYKFELKVTDNSGGVARDTVQVTVNLFGGGNQSPIANAGTDQTVTLPTNTTSLAGTGSDPDGNIASYSWIKLSGPTGGGTIVNPTSATTNITGLLQGTYQFQLTVTDNNGATSADAVQVTVNAATNQAPTANAGTDKTVTLPTNTTSLAGSGTDPDGTIASYAWVKLSGPTGGGGAISSPTSATTNITGLLQGTYQFQLTVTDNNGATATDVAVVTVNPAGNVAPTANAGTDKSITLPTNTTSLAGIGTDPDGTIAAYAWTKVSGPTGGGGTIASPTSATTNITALIQGVYKFELKVTDNSGAVGRDTVQITVNAAVNQLPVANAGTDQTVTLPTSTTTLSGSGTDADGTITSYAWVKLSGPTGGGGAISSPTSATTNITGLLQGTYQFQLTVTDNNGGTATDVIQVTVNASAASTPYGGTPKPIPGTIQVEDYDNGGQNIAYNDLTPTVNSGAFYRLTEGIDIAAAATEGNAYIGWTDIGEWTKYSVNVLSTATYTLTARVASMNTASSFRVEMDGTTIATITVPNTGAYEAWQTVTVPNISLTAGLKTMRIYFITGGFNINSVTFTTPNIAPVANAGTDKVITLPTSTVALTGSGTDVDGTIASYLWTKVSGPTSGAVASPTLASTTATGLVLGIYKFELKVTDNGGAVGRDTVQVTVSVPNQPPVSNAGADKSITLPTSSLSLAGTATDPDGTVASYLWTKVSGPASGAIVSPTSATTTVTTLVQGTYKFELRATDNSGAFGRDTVQVTVDPTNQPPVANAGADQVITVPASTVTLTGSGTDPDGAIASYAWTKVSGPASGTITTPNAASTTVTALVQGTYKFELKVTDNNGGIGAIDRDTVTIKVNALPTANAGLDQNISLPTSSVSLAGSGADIDGTITAYAWTKISGPTTFTITSPATAATTVTGLVLGTYQFQLRVTDSNGATATDVLQVIVNPLTNTPYTGVPKPIPGTIEVEDYDNGGQNIAYYDVTAGNSGGAYRPAESVDLAAAAEGTSYMGWSNDGEWTKYSVNVTATGTYSLVARVSSFSSVAKLRVEMDGTTIATVSVPNTAGYETWQNVTVPNIHLTAGIKTMRLYMLVGGFNITRVIFNQTGTGRNAGNVEEEEERIVAQPTNINTNTGDVVVNIYPNPVSAAAKVQLNNTQPGVYKLSLTDIFGKKVWTKMINNSAGSISETINMEGILNGIYILEVISPDQSRKSYKIIKN